MQFGLSHRNGVTTVYDAETGRTLTNVRSVMFTADATGVVQLQLEVTPTEVTIEAEVETQDAVSNTTNAANTQGALRL